MPKGKITYQMGHILYTIIQHGPTNLQSLHLGKEVRALAIEQVTIAISLFIGDIIGVHSWVMSISDKFYTFSEIAKKGGIM